MRCGPLLRSEPSAAGRFKLQGNAGALPRADALRLVVEFEGGRRRRLHALGFFFNDEATTELCTLSLHDALPISAGESSQGPPRAIAGGGRNPALGPVEPHFRR